ncbi:MAG TPA: hypothetical protein VNV42_01970 [Solirubrobacteraceae bacterium]|jgi:hypothetical protein|nr:hypothetical protein [Solirubrobacteraceae bacterium]
MAAAGSNGQPHSATDGPSREERVAAAARATAPSTSAPSPSVAGSAPSAESAATAAFPALPAENAQPALGGSLAALRGERVRLAERVASLTWDLGGLAYEMAIRDHYRLDVLARRAAELQQADAQLGEVERLLAAAQDGVGGNCKACGAVHSRGAAYCWRCGSPLLVEARPSVA